VNTPQVKAPFDGGKVTKKSGLGVYETRKASTIVEATHTRAGASPVPLVIFEQDSMLGRDLKVVITVKTTFQCYKNLRQIEQQQRPRSEVFGRERARQYVHGVVAAISLAHDRIDWSLTRSDWAFSAIEPYAVDVHRDMMALSGGDYLTIIDLNTGKETPCRHPWLSQAHSVQFSADGKRLLAASTGFDAVLEFFTSSGKVSWEWFAWDHGIDRSMLGHYMVREREKQDSLTALGKKVMLVDAPALFEYGVATRLIPAHLNSARYDKDGRILVSLFHQGTGVIIDRVTGKVEEIVSGLVNPHKLARRRRGGYFISDTRRGHLVLLDESRRRVEEIALPGLPGVERSPILSEFLQNATELEEDLFACVDIHRNSIWLVDVKRRRYRGIKFPREWSVHDVVSLKPEQLTRIGKLVGKVFGKVEACATEQGKVIRHYSPGGGEIATLNLDAQGRAIGFDVEM
jgi:hypothetical protein